MPDHEWPAGVVLAEFGDADALLGAARMLRARGYRRIESYTPYPVPGLPEVLDLQGSPLPALVFVFGVVGAVVSYGIQWYANVVSYPLNIGGRPAHAVPAFIVPTFEGTVLCAGLAAFVGLFAVLRLPRPWHPVFEIDGFERATVDRYWLAVDLRDRPAGKDSARHDLETLHALQIVHLGRTE